MLARYYISKVGTIRDFWDFGFLRGMRKNYFYRSQPGVGFPNSTEKLQRRTLTRHTQNPENFENSKAP